MWLPFNLSENIVVIFVFQTVLIEWSFKYLNRHALIINIFGETSIHFKIMIAQITKLQSLKACDLSFLISKEFIVLVFNDSLLCVRVVAGRVFQRFNYLIWHTFYLHNFVWLGIIILTYEKLLICRRWNWKRTSRASTQKMCIRRSSMYLVSCRTQAIYTYINFI